MSKLTCSVDGCEKIHYGKTWCQMHYNRMRKTGSVELAPKEPNYCKVDGCGILLVPPYGRGMCSLHYKRFMKHGDPHYTRTLIVGVAECSIDGCLGIVQARGWCPMHLTRWDRYGDPLHRYGYEVHDGKRVCAKCKVDKPLEDFGVKLNSYCMRCTADRAILRRKLGLGRDKMWAYSAQRRAQKLRTRSERFSRLEIFDRDGWVCRLCDRPIDATLSHPDPWHGNVDHIIPLSRGGTHTRDNVQAAHFRCNLQKGVSVPA